MVTEKVSYWIIRHIVTILKTKLPETRVYKSRVSLYKRYANPLAKRYVLNQTLDLFSSQDNFQQSAKWANHVHLAIPKMCELVAQLVVSSEPNLYRPERHCFESCSTQ